MTTYDDLYPTIKARVPNIDDPNVEDAVRQAAREFCEQSGVWRKELEDIDVVADQQDYDLSSTTPAIPDNTEIRSIVWVKLSGAVQSTRTYELYEGATLRFGSSHIPGYSKTDGMDIKLALMPDRLTEDVLPGWFITRWQTGLIAGARMFLAGDPGLRCYNVASRDRETAIFDREVARARASLISEHKDQDGVMSSGDWVV